jgi:uncharacterized protein YqjF (DUF2071 family)
MSIPAPFPPPVRRSMAKLNLEARRRMEETPGDPFFLAGWQRVLFLHYEVEAEKLRAVVPFELDLWAGKKAIVSLVAFTMEGMRPSRGGQWTKWLMAPIATHDFLNVRAYVRHEGVSGIYFLREWLSNRLATRLGPLLYGVPYHFGTIEYDHRPEEGVLEGEVCADDCSLRYRATVADPSWERVEEGSRDEFLLERYTAFTCLRTSMRRRSFRVWHEPWRQAPVEVCVEDSALIRPLGPWAQEARFIGANYSPGVTEVWMGWPRGVG